MANPTRKYDQLQDDISVRERVRKLEVMDHSRTLVPKLWKPVEDLSDLMFDLIVLVGVYERTAPNGNGTVLNPRIRPEANLAYQRLLDLGTNITETKLQQLTECLWKLGALPEPVAFGSGMTFGKIPGEGDEAVMTITQKGVDAPGNSARFVGIPGKGAWSWFNAGTHPGSFTMPDLSSMDWWNGDPGAIRPGALLGSFEGGNGIFFRNNTAGFSGTQDCEGPTEPIWNSFSYPGIPIPYDSGSTPCPANESAVFHGGSIMRNAMVLAGTDMFLNRIPWPYDGTNAGRMSSFGPYINYDFIQAGLATMTGLSWYQMFEGYLRDAQALLADHKRKNWQALPLYYPWRGLIEAKYDHGLVTFRGTILKNFTNWQDQNQTTEVLRLPGNLQWGTANAYMLVSGTMQSEAGDYSGPIPLRRAFLNEDRWEGTDPWNDPTIYFSLDANWLRTLVGDDNANGTVELTFDGATITAIPTTARPL